MFPKRGLVSCAVKARFSALVYERMFNKWMSKKFMKE